MHCSGMVRAEAKLQVPFSRLHEILKNISKYIVCSIPNSLPFFSLPFPSLPSFDYYSYRNLKIQE
jgi:hypothetical protein